MCLVYLITSHELPLGPIRECISWVYRCWDQFRYACRIVRCADHRLGAARSKWQQVRSELLWPGRWHPFRSTIVSLHGSRSGSRSWRGHTSWSRFHKRGRTWSKDWRKDLVASPIRWTGKLWWSFEASTFGWLRSLRSNHLPFPSHNLCRNLCAIPRRDL